jgi:hypothetical protein
MKKIIKHSLIAIVALSATLTACKKYDEGPTLSLASKTSRISNNWKMEKLLQNGTDVTANFQALGEQSIEIKKDGSYAASFPAHEGKWEFSGDKETVTLTPNDQAVGGPPTVATILKLKSDELWMKWTNTLGDFEEHLVTK